MKNVSPKNQVLIFLAITFLISWTEAYFIITSEEGIKSSARAFVLMWTPGTVALVLSWVFGAKWKDIGFKIGAWRNYGISYAVPMFTAILILMSLVVTGLGSFELSPQLIEKTGSVQSALIKVLILGPLLGTFFGFISGLGEEIGWRGFLHSRLMSLNIPHPFLVTGIIWAVWHWPLILFSNYATSDYRFLSVALFTVMTVSLSVFMGWMRERSGSVYTAALIHGVHNLWVQAMYPAFLKKGPLDAYFGGESGVFNALFYFIVAVYVYRNYLEQNSALKTVPA